MSATLRGPSAFRDGRSGNGAAPAFEGVPVMGIAERERRAGEVDVTNGTARDGRTLYVTGKLRRSVYGLELPR